MALLVSLAVGAYAGFLVGRHMRYREFIEEINTAWESRDRWFNRTMALLSERDSSGESWKEGRPPC